MPYVDKSTFNISSVGQHWTLGVQQAQVCPICNYSNCIKQLCIASSHTVGFTILLLIEKRKQKKLNNTKKKILQKTSGMFT